MKKNEILGSSLRPTDVKAINGMSSSVITTQEKKLKMQTYAGEAMASPFLGNDDFLLVEFLE